MRTPHRSRLGRASMLAALLLCAPALLCGAPLDIDGDGSVAPATDGQLILRHLFGFSGPILVNGAVAPGALRDADAIGDYLAGMGDSLDVDGDGRADALTDGILILRRLHGRTGDDLTVGALSPGTTRDAAAIAARIDGIPAPAGQTPARVTLVQANSLATNSIQLDWLPTFDNDTPGSRIRYVLHASQQEGFVPDSSTARTEVTDNATGTINGLTAATTYYVKVQALDTWGNASWSNELRAVTAAADPQPTAAPRQVLDASNAPDQNPLPDRIDYRLGAGSAPPAAGDYLVSAEGEGFLRRATGVQRTGDQVSVTTEPAALNELFTNLDLSTEIKLIDLPESAGPQARSVGRGVLYQRAGNTVRATWPESGLTILETRPPSATPRSTRPLPRAAGAVGCNGVTATLTSKWDDDDRDRVFKATYPGYVCIEPGRTLTLEVKAEIAPELRERYRLDELWLRDVRHPSGWYDESAVKWDLPNGQGDTQWRGWVTWTPHRGNLDDALRPFTARFGAMARERDGHCTGIMGWCETKTVYFETDIVVSWGEYPTQREFRFAPKGQLDLSVHATVDFQPTIVTEARTNAGRLSDGRAALQGPISLTTEVGIHASGEAELSGTEPLLDKRFTKIFTAGTVPIVINGHLKLDLQYRGTAAGKVDLTQTLQLGFDLLAGLQYTNGRWETLTQATPWQRYDLRGEAEAHGFVELRLVPQLEIALYDVVTGELVVEPYLYGEAAVEGHFMYGAENTSGGYSDVGDADYRFTKLEFGGGIDARFRAALEVFDYTLAEYPWSGTLIAKTKFLGLPTLTPAVGQCGIDDCAELGLQAAVANIPNPFGGESLNPFVPESANWKVVYKEGAAPDGTEQIERDEEEPTTAWLKAQDPATYTLRFSGNSKLGNFIRQYEDLEVKYNSGRCCDRWAVVLADGGWYSIASDLTGVKINGIDESELGSSWRGGFNLTSAPDGRVFTVRVTGASCTGHGYFPQKTYVYEIDFDGKRVLPPVISEVDTCLPLSYLGPAAIDQNDVAYVIFGTPYAGARVFQVAIDTPRAVYGAAQSFWDGAWHDWLHPQSLDFSPKGLLYGWSDYWGLNRVFSIPQDSGYAAFATLDVEPGAYVPKTSEAPKTIQSISFSLGGTLFAIGDDGEFCILYKLNPTNEVFSRVGRLKLDTTGYGAGCRNRGYLAIIGR